MKNKKRNMILTLVAMVLVAVGGTYAWWTASVSNEQKITMGNLKIEASFSELADSINYEPGLFAEIEGTVTNTGSIESIARIENTSQIKLAYLSDAMEVDLNPEFTEDKENGVKLDFGPSANDQDVYWFKDVDDNAYVLFEIGGQIEPTIKATFDGKVMKNKYQEAEIKIGAKINATQVLDGAMQSEFGIDMNDLVDFDTQSDSRRSGDLTKGEKRLRELLARGK